MYVCIFVIKNNNIYFHVLIFEIILLLSLTWFMGRDMCVCICGCLIICTKVLKKHKELKLSKHFQKYVYSLKMSAKN